MMGFSEIFLWKIGFHAKPSIFNPRQDIKNYKIIIIWAKRPTSKSSLDISLYLIYCYDQAALDDATEPWGIKVERVEM